MSPVNFVWSVFKGKKAPPNPWRANSLEWTLPSPPPHGNFTAMPVVHRGPYEYSAPGAPDDFWPQDAAPGGPSQGRHEPAEVLS